MDAQPLTTNMHPPPQGPTAHSCHAPQIMHRKTKEAFFKLDGMKASPGRKPCTYTNQLKLKW